MKIALLTLLLSFNAFAHQYIQCHNDETSEWNVVVISLNQDRSGGTLYLHEGFGEYENPTGPFKIRSNRITRDITTFKGSRDNDVFSLFIPTSLIGKSFSNAKIMLRSNLASAQFWKDIEYVCFSAIYNEEDSL